MMTTMATKLLSLLVALGAVALSSGAAFISSSTSPGSSSSSCTSPRFVERAVSTTCPSPSVAAVYRSSEQKSFLEMGKGKSRVPPQMRGQYKQAQKMNQMRDQMDAASKPGSDGLPVFNLYVRSKKTGIWYPCGSFKGDEKSKALAQNYSDGNLLQGLSKNQLDSGVSGSLYRDLPKLNESIFRGYPQLRKSRNDLEYGYKLAFEGLPEDKTKMNVVSPEKKDGFLDNVKGIFGQ